MYKLLKLFILQYLIVCALAFVDRFYDDDSIESGNNAHQPFIGGGGGGEFEYNRNEIEIACPFDLVDGGNVCDCGYRQEVRGRAHINGKKNRLLNKIFISELSDASNGWTNQSNSHSEL